MQTRTGDLAKNGIGLAGDQAFKFRLRHVEPDADARLLVVVTVYEVSPRLSAPFRLGDLPEGPDRRRKRGDGPSMCSPYCGARSMMRLIRCSSDGRSFFSGPLTCP
jgi:hypothetical protein